MTTIAPELAPDILDHPDLVEIDTDLTQAPPEVSLPDLTPEADLTETPVQGVKAIYFDDQDIPRAIRRRFNVNGVFYPAGTNTLRRVGRTSLRGVRY